MNLTHAGKLSSRFSSSSSSTSICSRVYGLTSSSSIGQRRTETTCVTPASLKASRWRSAYIPLGRMLELAFILMSTSSGYRKVSTPLVHLGGTDVYITIQNECQKTHLPYEEFATTRHLVNPTHDALWSFGHWTCYSRFSTRLRADLTGWSYLYLCYEEKVKRCCCLNTSEKALK